MAMRRPEKDTGYPSLSLPCSLAAESLPEPGIIWAAGNPPVSTLHRTGVTGACSYTQLFTWALGIRTQDFVLGQQMRLPTGPSSQSLLGFKNVSLM